MNSRSSTIRALALAWCIGLPNCQPTPVAPFPGRSDAVYPTATLQPSSDPPPTPTLTPAPFVDAPAAESAPAATPETPETPVVAEGPSVTLEPPYRFGETSTVSDRAAANRGNLGTLTGQPPPPPVHPFPRIVIEVPGTRGPHPRKKVEAKLRSTFWHQTVECYREGAYLDQSLKGEVELIVSIMANGEVKGARVQSSSFKEKSVSQCLAQKVRKLTLTRSRRGSDATVIIKIWPGDDPVPPPDRLVIPGDGALAPETVVETVQANMAAFRTCYESALEYAPELWGRLAVRIHVTDAGHVDEAFEVESTFPDEHVRRCVLGAALKLTFPAPDAGEMRMVLPFRFAQP